MIEGKNINISRISTIGGVAILASLMVACSPQDNSRSTTIAESVARATPAESTKAVESQKTSERFAISSQPSLHASPNVITAPQDETEFEKHSKTFDPNTTVGLNGRDSFKAERAFITNKSDLDILKSKLGGADVYGFQIQGGNVFVYHIANLPNTDSDKIVIQDDHRSYTRVSFVFSSFSNETQNMLSSKHKIDFNGKQFLRLTK